MTYAPPHLRHSVSGRDERSDDADEVVRRRKREYAEAGAPADGRADKVRLVPNVYFFRRADGTEGLGIWCTKPGATKSTCERLPGMPTIRSAQREVERRRAGLSASTPPDDPKAAAVTAAEAASEYLVALRRTVRAAGPAGSNDTRRRSIEQGTWDKKRSAFSTCGLLTDIEGRFPELLGEGRTMTRRERARRRFEDGSAKTYDAGPLAGYDLEEIDDAVLIELIDYLMDRSLLPSTIVTYLGQLRKFFKYCVRKDLLAADPFGKLEPDELPQLSPFRRRALTDEELLRLLAELPTGLHRTGALFDVDVGARIGERLALVWSDFDFKENAVDIESSRGRGGTNGSVKTAAAVRRLPFSPAIGRWLEDYRERSPAPGPGDPVWCRSNGGAYTPAAFRKEVIAPAILRAGLNNGLDRRMLAHASRWVTQHSLRHTYASVLLSDPTIDLITASMLLGHADIAVTLRIYSHYIENDRRQNPVRRTLALHLRELTGGRLADIVGVRSDAV
jgi:integrase